MLPLLLLQVAIVVVPVTVGPDKLLITIDEESVQPLASFTIIL